MDEPDAPLSFTSSLALIAVLSVLVTAGSQIVLATHSPIVAATPGATIFELGHWGLRATAWEDLQLVEHWSVFLANPTTYLGRLSCEG